jgi:tripartite-type tricarboxylate transporter receptor subunit TctC
LRTSRILGILTIIGALLCAVATGAQAQAYPSRLVTLVVPFPAGSTTDNVARKLADFMRSRTGASVIVDNRVGADGNVAAQSVLRSPADGYTVFVTGNSVHGANANLYKELPFDPINDFDMVGGVMTIPMVLTVRSDFPAASVQDFVAETKRRQKPLFYATGNNSTRGASELFKARYGLAVDHVPYRGSPQVLADLIGGQFDFAFIDVNTVTPALKDGRLKGLAITSEKRLPALHEIPTVAEHLPGFQFGAWVGVVVRAKTPPEVVVRLSSLVGEFVADPATVAYLASIGSAPMPMGSGELKRFIESETRSWAEIVRAANIEKK